MPFKLGTFAAESGPPFPGLVLDSPRGQESPAAAAGNLRVVPLDRIAALHISPGKEPRPATAHSLLALLDCWDESFPILCSVVENACEDLLHRSLPLDELWIHPPIEWPRQIFCTVANYRGQIAETIIDARIPPHADAVGTEGRRAYATGVIEERLRNPPYVCTKLPSTIAGPNDELMLPRHAKRLDWELELGVVIGRPCHRVSRSDAMAQIAGYMLVNDITARDLVRRTDLPTLGTDWLQSKCGPGFLPTGPYFVPASFIPDPYSLRLMLELNGRPQQDAPVSDMLFDIAAQIEYISSHSQLLPGDLICTGTPAGCGTHHGRYLAPGDLIEAGAPGLGVQRVRCMAQPFR
jgi:2,4-diketo-3-deoxy-L-fuconate hydrolase